MKKRIIRLFIATLVIGVVLSNKSIFSSLFKSPTAEAVGDLSVDWGVPEGNPIFTINNMAPGQSETRAVIVHNDASLTRPVGVRGIKTNETGALAGTFQFKISKGGVDIYGGTSSTGPKTLANFFSDSAGPDGIKLEDLPPSTSATYTFIAQFKPDSGNEFQQKIVVFDLKIGLSIPAPAECAQNNLDGNVIFGTQGNDTLKGTSKGDLIFALEGNDVVQGGSGDDCIVGGPGNNVLLGENGADTILGGEGSDSILGGNDADKLFGGAGNDSIRGDKGDDSISGGDGTDSLWGGNGNDAIVGGANNDSLFGDNGDDVLDGGTGNDSLNGGFGNDQLIGGVGIDSGNGSSGTDVCSSDIEFKFSCEL